MAIPRNRYTPALLALSVLTSALMLASCSNDIEGTAVYQVQDAPGSSTLVRANDLAPIVLPLRDLGALLNAPDLTPIDNPAIVIAAPGSISDVNCAAVLAPGWQSTYRTSGFVGAQALAAEDQHENHIVETVAAFPSPGYARAFVGANVAKWKSCLEHSLTVSDAGKYSSVWMAFDPIRADGIDVVLVRREGGRGYACGRGIAARVNVTADVSVCGRDEVVVKGQAADLVQAILARIPA
jgi:hypothetical protein